MDSKEFQIRIFIAVFAGQLSIVGLIHFALLLNITHWFDDGSNFVRLFMGIALLLSSFIVLHYAQKGEIS
jgi:hypothetical protein